MASVYQTNSIIAARAAYMLENMLAARQCMYQGYQKEYDKSVNGYKVGDTITIPVPPQYTVRTSMTRSAQDITIGTRSLVVDKVAGVDFNITSLERTFKLAKFDEMVLKPALIKIANQMDTDAMAYALQNTADWVGTPGTAIGSFDAFAAGKERLTEHGSPVSSEQVAMLNPRDRRGLATAIVGLNTANVNAATLRTGLVGTIDGVETYVSQNVASFTAGTRGGTPLVNGASQNVTYGTTNGYGITQSLICDGASNSITNWARAGDVFTIAGVYDVNPITKATLPNLKQFTVTAAANSDGSGNFTLTITPAIISSGAFQTVSAAPADNAALTMAGTLSVVYRPSLIMDKKAFAFVCPPLAKPDTAVISEVKTYKGVSVSLTGGFDVSTRDDQFRLDVIYGYKAIDPSLSVRVNG
jgi:hypothetical protein